MQTMQNYVNLKDSLAKIKAKTIAVLCNQFGDTGKGKWVDLLASAWADIVVRSTGGANAGHTLQIGSKKFITHLIPSGMLNDVINILGQGVAIDPHVLLEELGYFQAEGYSTEKLLISFRAPIVLPHHIVLDGQNEIRSGKGRVGTTVRGIGPCFTDQLARYGIIMGDLEDKALLRKKIKRTLDFHAVTFKSFNKSEVKKFMIKKGLGKYYSNKDILDLEAIASAYYEHGQMLKEKICDTEEYVRNAHGKKNILFEGAQGALLDIDEGTYPDVTCSNPVIRGLAWGGGLNERDVDRVFGLVKVNETRVGGGPMPSEHGSGKSEKYCDLDYSKIDIVKQEWEKYAHRDINTASDFARGIILRIRGGEYGATTGRPRRTGWLDLVLLRHAMKQNGPDLILSMVDVLTGIDELRVCDEYEYKGKSWGFGALTKGMRYKVLPSIRSNILRMCRAQYIDTPGWNEDISDMKTWKELPSNVKKYVKLIEKKTGGKVRGISVGADRDQFIWM